MLRSHPGRACYNAEVPAAGAGSKDWGTGELKSRDHLIWIDLEMTGLDPDRDLIIEIATVVTDRHLLVLEEGPDAAIHQDDSVLDAMDEWNTNQHNSSGLVERVRASKIDEAEAEQQSLAFLRQYLDPGISPMCGNGICQDRRFLIRHMPELAAFFHYRNLDVSSLKILARLWAPAHFEPFEKPSTHLAMADIHDSIRELKYYRDHMIRF